MGGPFSANSRNGCHYIVTIVDDFSRYTLIHLMQSKAQTCAYIQSFFQLIETQFNCKIKVLRLDNGPEFNMAVFFFFSLKEFYINLVV
jgi:IS30 family transposase